MTFDDNDKRIVKNLIEKPLDDIFFPGSIDEDPLELLMMFHGKKR